jgi:hypothetical protein
VSPVVRPAGVIARYVVLGAALGLPIGLLWVWLAPRVVVSSITEVNFVDPYPQGFAEADLILGALLLVAGIGIGVVAAIRLHRTGFAGGWVHVVGAMAAAGVCAAVARVAGWWLAGRSAVGQPDGTYQLPVSVGADGVLLLGIFAALLVVLLVAVVAREPVMTGSVPSGPSLPQ